jgi:hypothetical protein
MGQNASKNIEASAQKKAPKQKHTIVQIFGLPKELGLFIISLLDLFSQLELAKTCTASYAYYLEHLVVLLCVGCIDDDSKKVIMDYAKRAQYYVGPKDFLNCKIILPNELKDFQSSNVRYPIKSLCLLDRKNDLHNVIVDLNEKSISSLTSLELTYFCIDAKTTLNFPMLPSLKHLCFRECVTFDPGLPVIFANSSQLQKLEILSAMPPRILELPSHLKRLTISEGQYLNLDIDMSKCNVFEYITMNFYRDSSYLYIRMMILPQIACLREIHCSGLFTIKDVQARISALYNLEVLDIECEALKNLSMNILGVTELITDPDHIYHLDLSMFKNFEKLRIMYFNSRGNFIFTFSEGKKGTFIQLELAQSKENNWLNVNFCELSDIHIIMLNPGKTTKISVKPNLQITIEGSNDAKS